MKKILLCCLLFLGIVCIGCQNNDNFDKDNIEEIDIEEVDVNEEDNNKAFVNIDGLFEKGKKLLEEGKVNEAIEQFNKALEINNDADWVHGDLGRAKEKNNDLNGAIECYTKAIELNNNRSVYYQWRADAYKLLGKEDLSKQDQKNADDLHAKGMD